MYRIYLLLLIFFLPLSIFAQQRTKIILQNNPNGGTMKNGVSFLRGPVTFRHDNATLSCDSAVFYEARNLFEAFKNVHINQNDTINIYSDFLTYDGNTKLAHLTSNVKMIDNQNTLTTNVLDYNTGTKIGTYVDGGKIVNKDITLTSKNGYYFSNSRDAYFRYNVVAVTQQVRITSDTLRYNTLTNWAYFYGPTNIKGKEDNLYTENGAYNTKTEYAYFGKRNLYTNDSKSLKGDSLYYDGKAGYGKAVRNIIFKDTSDKTVLYGQLGFYYKADERAVVTKNAYVGLGTNDTIEVKNKKQPDTLWMGADTLVTQKVLQSTLKLIPAPVLLKDNELGDPEEAETEVKSTAPARTASAAPKPAATTPAPGKQPNQKKLSKAQRKALEKLKTDSLSAPPPDSLSLKKGVADSLLKALPDSTIKAIDSVAKKAIDTGLKRNPAVQKAVSELKKGNIAALAKPTDSSLKKLATDTVKNPLDTVKARIIKAYHKVRVYKGNMQAVADSLFYTAADSTLRWFGKPILWSQGSQQIGDTIYLRIKDKKLKSLQVVRNAFVINVNADSAKYNQIKGKLITAFFTNGELSNMFVDGNAESVYYNRDKDSVYIEMNQTVSSRIKVLLKDKEITDVLAIKGVEGAKTPLAELGSDVKLTGFSWVPELRPLSKQEVISGKPKPKVPAKAKPPVKKPQQPAAKPKTTVAKEIVKATSGIKLNDLKKPVDSLKKMVGLDSIKIDTTKIMKTVPLKKQ